jgi:protein tyrosine/serine phosphatase
MNTLRGQVRSVTLATLATLTLAIGASAQTSAAAPSVRMRIDNFARVSDTYFRGAQPVGSDYADLAKLGVKTIINLIGDSDLDAMEQSSVEKLGMRYVYIPMSTHQAPTAKQLEAFLSIVNDSASQPVYVHCVGGRHRTGVMTAVYRMNKDGLSGQAAFQEMKKFNYGPDFLHPEFKKFVYGYQPTSKAAVANTSSQQ